jgi:hypothetical protein
MTTSGVAVWNPDLNEIVEEAHERCSSELRTGYDLRTARRSLSILLAGWSNLGINLWTIDSGTINLVQGTSTYNLPDDTVDLIEHVIRTGAGAASTQADLTITRISVSTYSSIPNKLQQARPIQVWVNRQAPTPQITIWPTPDGSQQYQFIYWRLRRLQDPGAGGTYTQDIPFRFIPPLISGLAYYLSMKIPGAMERMLMLKAQYDQDLELAMGEDRDKSAVRFTPRQYFIS